MNLLFKLVSSAHTFIYRKTGGTKGGILNGQQVVLLTTKGRKTGAERTVPVMAFADGGDWIVVASKGGAPKHPAWFLNLEAEPSVSLQVGSSVRAARASVLDTSARREWWQRIVATAPQFGGYEKKTTREIPLVRLSMS